jgi:hypothetical protein
MTICNECGQDVSFAHDEHTPCPVAEERERLENLDAENEELLELLHFAFTESVVCGRPKCCSGVDKCALCVNRDRIEEVLTEKGRL